MARVWSIGRLATPTSYEALQAEGETPNIVTIVLISEAKKAIVESKASEKGDDALEDSGSEAEVSNNKDDGVLRPSKVSHIEFGQSTVRPEDLDVLKRLGYIGEKEDDMIILAGDETIPEPKNIEIVVFRSFFWVRL